MFNGAQVKQQKKKSEFQVFLVTQYIICCERILNISLLPHKLAEVMAHVILGYTNAHVYEPPDH